jgi:hypothetical protein
MLLAFNNDQKNTIIATIKVLLSESSASSTKRFIEQSASKVLALSETSVLIILPSNVFIILCPVFA